MTTAAEIQLLVFEPWPRSELADGRESIVAVGGEVVPLTTDVLEAGPEIPPAYPASNPFEAVHGGHAVTLDEPVVSTDSRYPELGAIDHLDPRER